MQIDLLSHTEDGERLVYAAARQCYSEMTGKETYAEYTKERAEKLLDTVLKSGHTSVLEHANYTFAISGISRVTSHQLVRFRHMSFSQQSQRYTTLNENASYVLPPSIAGNVLLAYKYRQFVDYANEMYQHMVTAGVPKEDARYLIPHSVETSLILTTNARELHHAFKLRCCTRAQWEIRAMFTEMLKIVQCVHYGLFKNAGPSCVTGRCPEGKFSCKGGNQC